MTRGEEGDSEFRKRGGERGNLGMPKERDALSNFRKGQVEGEQARGKMSQVPDSYLRQARNDMRTREHRMERGKTVVARESRKRAKREDWMVRTREPSR